MGALPSASETAKAAPTILDAAFATSFWQRARARNPFLARLAYFLL
jgi:hypothetical protein